MCTASSWEPTPFSSTGELESSELAGIFEESEMCDFPVSRPQSLGVTQTAGYEGVQMVCLPDSLCSVIGEEARK